MFRFEVIEKLSNDYENIVFNSKYPLRKIYGLLLKLKKISIFLFIEIIRTTNLW